MGETGCGKTSLIRHLAKLLSVNFKCLNVHAGTSAEDIMAFVEGVQVVGGGGGFGGTATGTTTKMQEIIDQETKLKYGHIGVMDSYKNKSFEESRA